MLITSLALAQTDWHYLEFREVDDTEAIQNWFGEDLPIFVKDGIPQGVELLPNKLIYKTPTILIVEERPFADHVYMALTDKNPYFQIAIGFLEHFDDPIAFGVFFRQREDLDGFAATGYAAMVQASRKY